MKMRVSKQILSILLCLAMLLTFIPITAHAAADTAPYAPEIINEVVWGRDCIFANGTPITIEAAGSGTAVWYMDGETKKYVNPNGENGDDLSEWIIFGGSNNPDGMYFDTYVTMTGGKVRAIYAGIYSMGYLNGTAHVTVTGGTVTKGIYCNTYLSSTHDKTKTVTIFDSTGVSINLNHYGVADNVVQKKGSEWTVSGNGIIPEGVTVTVSEGETLTVPSGATLKNNGALVNSGGTITVYGNLSGNAPENYTAPKDFTFNTAELEANVPYTMSEAVCTTDNTTLSPWFTYEIENQGTTDAVLSGREITAKNEGTVTVKVTMHDGYGEPISKTFDFPVSSDIEKAYQTAPAVSKTDETISAKNDGKITGVDSTMEYRKDGESTYTAITGTEVTGLGGGTYFVRYKETGSLHASPETEVTVAAGRKLTVKVPQNQVGYTMTTTTPEVDYFGSIHVEFKLHDGYSVTDDFQIYNGTEPVEFSLINGVYVYGLNFVMGDFDFMVKGVADITPPTVEIKVKDNSWTSFWNNLTFGLFSKETQDVTITATDKGSGVKSVQYYLSDRELERDEARAITDWVDYNGTFKINPDNSYVVYAKVTDIDGNVAYINSEGIILDATAPVIEGVENGKTYYTTQKVTVTDKNLDTVTLNGNPATENITLDGNKAANYTIVVTDKAGNSTTVTVTMKPIKELAKATENLGNDNVTSADAPALEELVAKLDELLADEDVSGEEQETLEQHKHIAEALLQTIDNAAEATDTENTEKVENVTPENVTPEDKTDLGKAKADLEKALEDNGGNYTEDEKKAIEDELGRINDALEVIGNVEAVEDKIGKLPENITKNDENAIKAADDAYNALSDYEKALVDEDAKKALNDAKGTLAELNKPAVPTSPATGDTSNLWLWAALLFVSGGAVVTLTVVDRKRRSAAKR